MTLKRGMFDFQLRSLFLLSGSLLVSPVLAQTSPIETITVTGQRATDVSAVSPTITPLDTVRPTSVISQDFIEKNLPLSGN